MATQRRLRREAGKKVMVGGTSVSTDERQEGLVSSV
mgnify:CR=1 FL=1